MNKQTHRGVRWGWSLSLGLLLAGLTAPPLLAAGPAPTRPASPQPYFLQGNADNYSSGTTVFASSSPTVGWSFNLFTAELEGVEPETAGMWALCWQPETDCQGLYAVGGNYGARGYAHSDSGYGMQGTATLPDHCELCIGFGAVGRTDALAGTGVEGYATNAESDSKTPAIGVYGEGGIGVAGKAPGTGVYGQTSGISLDSVGVYGSIPAGESDTGTGVYGHTASTKGFGVAGISPYVGVYGYGTGPIGTGVFAVSGQGTGLFAHSSTSWGGQVGINYTTSSSSVALEASNPITGSGHYAIVADGNVLVKGNLYTTKGGPVPYSPVTTDQGPRAMYDAAGTQTLFSDEGTGRLVAGRTVITLDPLYAQTVDLGVDYQVFLTPNTADTPGLTVVNKTATSFEVRELQGGRGTYRFDWRIDAVRKGYAKTRMTPAPPDPTAPPAAPVAPPPPPARPGLPHPVAPAPQAPAGSAPPPGAAGGPPRSPTR